MAFRLPGHLILFWYAGTIRSVLRTTRSLGTLGLGTNFGQCLWFSRTQYRSGFKISQAELGREIKNLRSVRDHLEAEIKALPDRVPVRETMAGKPVVRLERERKTITDTIKMVAYRAETQLANLVGPLLPYRDDEARKFIRQVFELPADLLPDYEQGRLLVRLHGMTTPRHNRALLALCAVLNELEVYYPGTRLRLVLEATQMLSGSH